MPEPKKAKKGKSKPSGAASGTIPEGGSQVFRLYGYVIADDPEDLKMAANHFLNAHKDWKCQGGPTEWDDRLIQAFIPKD